ncbi:MAG: hypothetical protein ACRDDY_08390 [Clostridium sp.]|uniref:hypothetical protein n=1 Tax=Clostridium sp. TaxID=1506 RepID=UPI003EE58A41
MDIVENIANNSNTLKSSVDKSVDNDIEKQISFFKVKQEYGFNETNLMTLPFISLKRAKEMELTRSWFKSNNEEVTLKVVGGSRHGVPQMAELDVLLALFRIHLKNNRFLFEKNNDNGKVTIPARINFTFSKLAEELGYKTYGGFLKAKLEKSIQKLNETTIYTKFAIYNAEEGEFVSSFKGEKSCRILKSYATYEKDIYKREHKGELLSPYEIQDYQYVEIDDFFLNNMCNGYYKVYDYEKYKGLAMSISKRILLILSTWSRSSSKFITYQVLCDYIGLDYIDKKQQYYANSQIKKAMKELVDIGYIDDFEEEKNRGINIIFNRKKLNTSTFKNLYNTESEIFDGLREYSLDIRDVGYILNNFDDKYVAAVLRCLKHKCSKGEIKNNISNYVMSAFGKTKWDVKEFL